MQDNLNSGSKEEMFLGYKSIFLPCPFKLKLLDIDTLCKHFTILWIIEYLNQNYNAPYIFEHCIKTLEIKAMKQTQQWFKTNERIYKIGNLYQKYDYTSSNKVSAVNQSYERVMLGLLTNMLDNGGGFKPSCC